MFLLSYCLGIWFGDIYTNENEELIASKCLKRENASNKGIFALILCISFTFVIISICACYKKSLGKVQPFLYFQIQI